MRNRFTSVHLSFSDIIIGGSVIIIGFLALYPISMLLMGSVRSAPPGVPGFFTLDNYLRLTDDVKILGLLINTLSYAGGTTLVSLVYGAFLGWIIMRTNTPFRNLILYSTLSFFIWPYVIKAIAYIFVLGPSGGVLNLALMAILRIDQPIFNVFSMPGLIFVGGMLSTPLIMLIMIAAFATMDPAMEEAARISGAGVLRTFRLTLGLLKPALASGAILVFIIGIESFETPAVIGMPAGILLFTTKIYEAMEILPNVRLATAYAVVLLVISLLVVYLYWHSVRRVERYTTVTGKAWRASLIDLGGWRYPVFTVTFALVSLTFILPMIMLIVSSFAKIYSPSWEMLFSLTLTNYVKVLENYIVVRAFVNSAFLSVVGSTLTVLLVAVASYITIRTSLRGKRALDFLSMMPIAFPGIVLAMGIIWAYLSVPVLSVIYGTIWIMMVAYITKYLPFGMRMMSGSVFQVHRDLEESARISGSSWITTFIHIMLPLIKPGLIATWIFLMIHYIKELSSSVLLYTVGTEVVAVLLFETWSHKASIEQVGAIGMLLVAIIFSMYFIVQKITGFGLTKGI